MTHVHSFVDVVVGKLAL